MAHPRIVKAIREQAAKLVHVSNLYYHEYQGAAGGEVVCSFGVEPGVFLEQRDRGDRSSIKLARLAGHRAGGEAKCRLVALDGSYHGRTFGALSLTGQAKHRKGFEPLLEDVKFVKQNDLEGLRAARERQYLRHCARTDFGEGGIYECSVEFLRECRELADRHRVALIFDEIQCGLGRTGTIFAFQSFRRDARHRRHRQAHCRGTTAGRIYREGRICDGDIAGTAWHDLWRRSAGLPHRAGVPGDCGGREAARECQQSRSLFAARIKQTGGRSVRPRRECAGAALSREFSSRFPARPIVDAALAEGVLFNSTQDTVVRFLPPF